MRIAVAITVLTGPHKNRRFLFPGPVRCTVGRADNCLVRFSGDENDLTISRRHCQLDINPPSVQLQDLGSLNGTYLNGKKLEPAKANQTGADLRAADDPVVSVKEGDVITLGGTSLRIDIVGSPFPGVTEDSRETPEHAAAKQECSSAC